MSDIVVTVEPVNIEVTIAGGAIGLQVAGEFLDDDDAIFNGLTTGQLYELAENNNYTLPAGLIKRIQ